RHGAPVRVHDRILPLDRITRSESERAKVYRWAWSVYLGDGMRALAAQGRWQQAAEQARLLGGVGQRLFDGRQVTVLAHLAGGETEQALSWVEQSQVHEPLERCVQLLLHLRCDRGAEGVEELVETIPTVKAPLFAARAALTGFSSWGADTHCPRSFWARWSTTRPRTATQPETFSQTHPPIWQELTQEISSACASMRGWAPRHFLPTFSPSLSKPCKSFLNSVRSPEDPAHCPTPLISSPRRGPYTCTLGSGSPRR